ncbi:hypothetical protein GS908_26380, partial [Rhodococcus hoagii]|nr:hypothetical protein [Prescottella equi]
MSRGGTDRIRAGEDGAARQAWADQAEAREANRKSQPWVATDATEAVWQYGFDAESKMPAPESAGTTDSGTGNVDGQGSLDTDKPPTPAARRSAGPPELAGEFAQANDIP